MQLTDLEVRHMRQIAFAYGPEWLRTHDESPSMAISTESGFTAVPRRRVRDFETETHDQRGNR